jgi:MFS family permease
MTNSTLLRARSAGLNGTAANAAVAAMIGALFAGSTMLTPLYVIYERQFQFSTVTLTLIYSVYVIGNLAALLVFGHVSDKIGRRPAAVFALAIAVVSALVFLFADGIAALYAARILSGLGIGVGAGTGTAWLAELIAEDDKARAATLATSTNFVGLAVGAMATGLLAQYAPWPLQLPFVVYIGALLVIAALIWRTGETVARPVRSLRALPLRPRLSVPRPIRAQFVAPAVTGFGAMALVGFFAALAPSILAKELHETSHAVAGALFFELAMIVALSIVLTQRLSSRAAMLWALALMLPGVGLLVAAQVFASLAHMIAASAVCGVAAGLGYRGSLQVVNQIAPAEQRAEVTSVYFVCGFSGNALPVIGIGMVSTLANSTVAALMFAGLIAAFALVALWFGARYTR